MVKVRFDSSLKFYMVSPSAWTATGATQWFKNYRIISTIDSPLADKLGMVPLSRYTEETPKTTKAILASPILPEVIRKNGLEDYKILLNRASSRVSDGLGNSFDLVSRYENKVWLRRHFADHVSFPPFRIIKFRELRRKDHFRLTTEMGADELIVQHASLAGSRGTYRLKTAEDLENCIDSLGTIIKDDDEVVVSVFVEAQERTLQVCVTESEILVGPPQAQLVSHPLLTASRPGDIQFCGGRIAPDLMDKDMYHKAYSQTQIIGNRLKKEGYRGIFGIDFLVSSNNLYTLEVNPRMTGLTTLLAFLQKDVPFLLLHILELAKSDYEITTSLPQVDMGSFIQVYAQEEGSVSLETGRYNRQGEKVGDGFEDGSIFPQDIDDCFVAMRIAKGAVASRGKSLAFIYSRRQLFNDDGVLDSDAVALIHKIRG